MISHNVYIWKREFNAAKLAKLWLVVTIELHCSQSPIFSLDRRCQSLSSPGRHLGFLMREKLGRVQNVRKLRRYFVFSPVSLPSRDQDGGPSNSTIDIFGKIGDCDCASSHGNCLHTKRGHGHRLVDLEWLP